MSIGSEVGPGDLIFLVLAFSFFCLLIFAPLVLVIQNSARVIKGNPGLYHFSIPFIKPPGD